MKNVLWVSLMGIALLMGCFGRVDDGSGVEEQLTMDFEIIDNYLKDIGYDSMPRDVFGQRYQILDSGYGDFPAFDDVVFITLFGEIIPSETFVYEDTTGVGFDLRAAIDSWRLGIPLIREGGTIDLYAPSSYCYGPNGLPQENVPPNANMHFRITLLNVAKDEELQLLQDIKKIDQYLEDNDIDATADPSGLRYVLHEEGNGNYALTTDSIVVKYKGTLLHNGQVFDENDEGATFLLGNLIEAWQIASRIVSEEGSITIYAPSTLCYGASSTGSIPHNSNLIFEIELVAIKD